MIPLIESIKICLALLTYYAVLQLFSDFIKAGQATNTPNRTISELMTKYKVNIRTFNKNNNHFGFCWFKTIWINESRFKKKDWILSTFFHELYHLNNNHKAWILGMRLFLSLIPLLLTIIHWILVLIVFLFCAMTIQYITDKFEKGANSYSEKMMSNEQDVPVKAGKSNK
jgi:hypothetical protein